MDSRAWDERYATADLVWGGAPNRWVAQETGELPIGRALDLATGEGRNAIWLAGRGWRVTAVDFSAVALDRGSRLAAGHSPEAAGRIDWVCSDVVSYEPEPAAYDLVVVCFLQLPAEQRARVLGGAAGALAPGGSLLVVGHDSTNLTEGTGGPQDPRVLFSPSDVLGDVAAAGLETVRADRMRRPVEQPDGGTRYAIDALVLLRRPEA
ncbi:class I SAM-dependent methyltransferase [Streptomyces sp. NPDC051940]|uniref:class I SAM-dependent methyltransferase n=1 Tax=Streptomyces sp. NPDC051940 TaxID=3155675 RepID=UPI00342F6292